MFLVDLSYSNSLVYFGFTAKLILFIALLNIRIWLLEKKNSILYTVWSGYDGMTSEMFRNWENVLMRISWKFFFSFIKLWTKIRMLVINENQLYPYRYIFLRIYFWKYFERNVCRIVYADTAYDCMFGPCETHKQNKHHTDDAHNHRLYLRTQCGTRCVQSILK